MKFKPSINQDRCKNCRLCVAHCPKQVITAPKDKTQNPEITNPEACIGCRLCEKFCPDFAIQVESVK